MLTVSITLQGEPPLALGLSTRKALSVLKEQLEAVLEKHLKERKKCRSWKVTLPLGGQEHGCTGSKAGRSCLRDILCLSPGQQRLH